MTAALLSHSQDHTLVLTIHNPEQHNALDAQIYAAGVEALNGAERNPDIRSVVITGSGQHFSAGVDPRRLLSDRSAGEEVQVQNIDGLQNWVETLHAFPKPVVAAVEGSCVDAGFSLALACDMVVAAHNSVYAMANSGLGLSPNGGASWNLARAVPRGTAMRWLMTGEHIPAERLHALGLISYLSAPGEASADALALCERLNARAPNALASIKELVNDAPVTPLHSHLGSERNHFVRNLAHANAQEGISAYLEKRVAQYR